MDVAKQIIYLLVGLVIFVTGMNFMSDGLKKCAGRSIRRLFKKIKDNKIASAAVGAGTTAIIQSSGATTVLVVGFLSAGALKRLRRQSGKRKRRVWKRPDRKRRRL